MHSTNIVSVAWNAPTSSTLVVYLKFSAWKPLSIQSVIVGRGKWIGGNCSYIIMSLHDWFIRESPCKNMSCQRFLIVWQTFCHEIAMAENDTNFLCASGRTLRAHNPCHGGNGYSWHIQFCAIWQKFQSTPHSKMIKGYPFGPTRAIVLFSENGVPRRHPTLARKAKLLVPPDKLPVVPPVNIFPDDEETLRKKRRYKKTRKAVLVQPDGELETPACEPPPRVIPDPSRGQENSDTATMMTSRTEVTPRVYFPLLPVDSQFAPPNPTHAWSDKGFDIITLLNRGNGFFC